MVLVEAVALMVISHCQMRMEFLSVKLEKIRYFLHLSTCCITETVHF